MLIPALGSEDFHPGLQIPSYQLISLLADTDSLTVTDRYPVTPEWNLTPIWPI